MVMPRPPGVRIERVVDQPRGLGVVETGVPCFFGLCERGPVSEPVRIAGVAEFHEQFGTLDVGSYLAAAIDGFFLNGGQHCYVVRIAHLFERARGEIATKASARLRDADKQNTLLISAASEGMWGNQVRVSVQHVPSSTQTFISVDAHVDEHAVTVKSTHGISRGTLVRIHDDEAAAYRVITGVEGRVLSWAEREPLERSFRSAAPTLIEPVGFDLIVETHRTREVFRGVNLSRQSPQFVERVVNGVSRLITVTSLEPPTLLPECFPAAISDVRLDGGTDGLFTVVAEDFIGADLGPGNRFGLAAIADSDEIDLLILPDLPWCLKHSAGFKSAKDMEIVQQAVVTQCELRRDRMALLDFPPDTTPMGAQQWRRLFDSSFAAFYFPWVIPSTGGPAIPPSGHIAGVVARCDTAQGVFRAPANEVLNGVVDLALFLQPHDLTALNNDGVNGLQVFAQRGIRVWGARTTSTDAQYRYLNVRRTVSTLARTINVGLQWVVFEPNSPELWATIERDVRVMLEGLWRKGWFRGGTIDEAFFVLCDERNNTLETRDAGQIVLEIGLSPLRPAEFVTVRLTQEVDVLSREDGA
jgi:hypothetical protein